MLELVRALKKEGREVYGLSNFSMETFPRAFRMFPVLQEIDKRLISAEVGYVKPEPEIFLHFFKKFNLEPEDCLFIDDSRTNVEMAERLGMQGIVFNRWKVDLKDLQL